MLDRQSSLYESVDSRKGVDEAVAEQCSLSILGGVLT